VVGETGDGELGAGETDVDRDIEQPERFLRVLGELLGLLEPVVGQIWVVPVQVAVGDGECLGVWVLSCELEEVVVVVLLDERLERGGEFGFVCVWCRAHVVVGDRSRLAVIDGITARWSFSTVTAVRHGYGTGYTHG